MVFECPDRARAGRKRVDTIMAAVVFPAAMISGSTAGSEKWLNQGKRSRVSFPVQYISEAVLDGDEGPGSA